MATAPTLPTPRPAKLKPVAVPALDAKLGKGPEKIGVLAFGVVLIIGVIYAGSSLASDLSGVHNSSILPYLARSCSAGGAGIRVRQRISRYGERRRHRDLHPFAGAAHRGGVVGLVEFSRGSDLLRIGGVRHHFAVAGRTYSAGWKQGRIRDGLRAPGRRYYLESQHVVFRSARLQFSHFDRFDHRSWYLRTSSCRLEQAPAAWIGHKR